MLQIISIFNFLISLLKNIKGSFQSDTKNKKANHPHDTSHQSQWFGDNKLFSQVNRKNEDASEVFMVMYNQFTLSIMDWSKQSHVMPFHFLFDASQSQCHCLLDTELKRWLYAQQDTTSYQKAHSIFFFTWKLFWKYTVFFLLNIFFFPLYYTHFWLSLNVTRFMLTL